MRRFIMRKLALFDWIDQLQEQDRKIAYHIYATLDHIRLYSRLPFFTALPCLCLPFLAPFGTSEQQTTEDAERFFILLECVSACICYVTGYLIFSFLVFGPMRTKQIRKLQQLFFTPSASNVLNQLILLDEELELQTHSLLRPHYAKPPRRARHRLV
ncbi:hypothetical protein A2318_03715 [Candidatus Uhrbacteria bacterium RIFOXYB2_FULL_45_11]|uniref:Uncharacterized protein n=1 Tax=Candidatus Uhrbacteria bacterium RIFOXYB2_FULL_45_11 TaxID=1802421 RepID=A0A1F7W349_9BACT|nr:MAG: hypothetical protein A2318_03715 [Candidatus Uhrbacteria bacterium RIFOXYB2_FULL_45_11]